MSETPLRFEDWNAARAFWVRARPQLSEKGLASRLAHSMRETKDGIGWRHDQAGIAQARLNITPTDLWPAVRALDCPTLFIRGGRSDFLPVSMLVAMKESNRRIRTLEIANATHYVHDDRNDMFNGVVMGYLASLVG
jgi:pimeloyl-ACP methyl ester carboxylesterase